MNKKFLILSLIACGGNALARPKIEVPTVDPADIPDVDFNALRSHAKKVGPFNEAIINFIDGKIYGINGQIVGIMLRARSEIIKISNGELQEDKKTRRGLYTYNGEQYTVKQLAKIEQSTPIDEELSKCLREAKYDFVDKMHAFLEPARNTKHHILPLIEDFCEYNEIDDSPLLRWGEAADEEEEREVFDADITSFTALEEFCSHLILFLKELVNCCPKGKAQFREIVAQMQKK